jgi:hypothetical protein
MTAFRRRHSPPRRIAPAKAALHAGNTFAITAARRRSVVDRIPHGQVSRFPAGKSWFGWLMARSVTAGRTLPDHPGPAPRSIGRVPIATERAAVVKESQCLIAGDLSPLHGSLHANPCIVPGDTYSSRAAEFLQGLFFNVCGCLTVAEQSTSARDRCPCRRVRRTPGPAAGGDP